MAFNVTLLLIADKSLDGNPKNLIVNFFMKKVITQIVLHRSKYTIIITVFLYSKDQDSYLQSKQTKIVITIIFMIKITVII